MKYVMKTTAMRTIPEAALPRLPAVQLGATVSPDASVAAGAQSVGIVTARDDSSAAGSEVARVDRATARVAASIVAPAAGLEPATRRLTAACSTD
jgi:hypothetical protein